MAIQALPETVQSFIRSGITIPSPAQAVEELILNSLDAGASSISVHIDFKYYKIQVTDNGCGISLDDLEAVGERYMTSKCYSLEDLRGNLKYFGYRGEALAAIREISGVLSIISRVKGQNEVFCKLFVQGKSNKAEIYDLQQHDVGTTVTIQDFMFNLPVRRTSIRETLEIEEIRAIVESIAIIHPQVSFNVHNDSKGTLVFQKHINSDILTSFTHIFGQLAAQSLASISFSNGKFRISGFIGKNPSRHKNLQFLYVNKRSLRRTKIHTLINNMLAKSSILRGNGPNRFKPIPKEMNAKSLMSFPKIERNKKFAVFIVQIQCNVGDYEISFDPKKTSIYFQDWSSLSNTIELCIRDFLKRENLVLSEVPVAQTSKMSAKCDALKELEELENETLGKDNISSNDKTFDDVPLTYYLPRAVHGLPAKRKKEKEKNFSISKNPRRKNHNLSPLNRQRICINENIEGIQSETTDQNSSYFLSSFERNLDLEKCSERNNRPICSDQNFINKAETINDPSEAPASNVFPFPNSCNKLVSGGNQINNIGKRGYTRFNNLRKFAANNDFKKKKLRSVNQDEDKQLQFTSHHIDSVDSKLDSRSNSVIFSNKDSSNLDPSDASFKFSPRINLWLEEQQILPQCEIKLNENLGNKNHNKTAHFKEKIIVTADDFIQTLEKEKITNKLQCKCKKEFIKPFDYGLRTIKFSEVNLSTKFPAKLSTKPLVKVQFKNGMDVESKLKRLINTKSSHSQFEEINKYEGNSLDVGVHKNKLLMSSPIITSPYFSYKLGNRSAEDIGKEVFKLQANEYDTYSEIKVSTIYSNNRIVQEMTSDYKSSDEQEAEEYSALQNSPCHVNNFDSYIYKTHYTNVLDSDQFDQNKKLNTFRNSTLILKEIDSSSCREENSVNYSPYINDAIDISNTLPNLKKKSVKRIIKQVSHKEPLTGSDKIDEKEKDYYTESLSSVSQTTNCDQLQFKVNKQIEGVVSKSNEFLKSPYFRDTPEGNERLSGPPSKLVENVTRGYDGGMSINIVGYKCYSMEDNSKNISDNINENETVINIGESNQNSLIEGDCEILNNATFQLKDLDYDVKSKTPVMNNSCPEQCSEEIENVSHGETYSMEDRFTFLPKGMSPILQYTHCAKKVLSPDVCQMLQVDLLNDEGKYDDITTVKWQQIFGSEYSGSKALIKKLCVEAENGLKRNEDVVRDGYDKKLLKLAEKVSEIMKPFHYTKTIFSNYKLIGQCDKKFIIIYCSFVEGKEPHVIGAFDQHAVHERIRVEALLKEYIQDDGNIFKVSDLDCELCITLSGKEFRIIIGYKSEFERLGLQFQIEDENRIKLITVPTCLYNRYLRVTSKRLTVLKDLLQKLITDHVEFLLKTHGIGFGIPEVLLDVINSEACHGAVKFGDPLSEAECSQMISDLAYCNKPFYCAHGRPTFCPIFDMNELHTKRPIMFNKLKPRY